MLSVWVDPIKEQVYRYAFKSRLPNPTGGVTLERLWSNIDLVRQCEEDGNHHIVPFVLALEKAPQDLKRAFGKGLWKQLCKNSLSRNRDLSRHWGGVVYFDVKRPFSEPSRAILRTLNKYPSRALKWKELGIVGGTGLWAARCSGFHKWGFEEFLRLRHIAQDTSRMASMLGEPFSLKWGAEEMVERHERYTAMQLSGEYSKEPFKVLEDFLLKEWHGEGGWSAHLLMSPYEVAEEGRAMRHCVAGYGGAVKSGSYLVYSFRKDGERRSTLGVKKCLKGGGLQCTGFIWDIDQHYGFGNGILTTVELAMGRRLLAELGGKGLEHYEEPEERRVA